MQLTTMHFTFIVALPDLPPDRFHSIPSSTSLCVSPHTGPEDHLCISPHTGPEIHLSPHTGPENQISASRHILAQRSTSLPPANLTQYSCNLPKQIPFVCHSTPDVHILPFSPFFFLSFFSFFSRLRQCNIADIPLK